MPTIEQSITINRPVKEVFAAVTDIGKMSRWISIITDTVDISSNAPAVGATYMQGASFMGKRIETPMMVAEYRPPEKFVQRSTGGPIPQELSLSVEPVGSETLLTLTFTAEPGGFFGPLPIDLLVTAMGVIITGNLNRLKTLLESGKWKK